MTTLRTKLLAILWAASLLWTYQFADRNVRNEYEAAKVPAMVKGIEKHNKKAVAGNKVEKKAMAKRAVTEATFDKLENEVMTYAQKHPAATDCSIDADGLRTWRAANAGTETDSTSEPDPRLRGPAPASKRPDTGSAGEPRQGGQEIQAVPRPAGRPGEVEGKER